MPLHLLAAALLTEAAGPSACQAPLPWSGTKHLTISAGGRNRTFRLSTPWASRPCPPGPHGFTCGVGPPNETAPLVIHWHGCNGHLPLLGYNLDISRVEDVALDRGYFAITPVGTRMFGGDGDYGWNTDGHAAPSPQFARGIQPCLEWPPVPAQHPLRRPRRERL